MSNFLTTLAVFLALGTGTAVAIFDSAPLITDALTNAGLGGFVGGPIAYRRERIAECPARLVLVLRSAVASARRSP